VREAGLLSPINEERERVCLQRAHFAITARL
jgi:hypothetical protein